MSDDPFDKPFFRNRRESREEPSGVGMGTRIAIGAGIRVVAAIFVGTGTYVLAPPIALPDGWQWAAAYGRFGVALAAGIGAFVVCWFFTVLSFILSVFNKMGEM